MNVESNIFETVPPIFQPLRLWTPRVTPVPATIRGKMVERGSPKKHVLFTMRGGLMSTADGERRLIIAGKMFRNLG